MSVAYIFFNGIKQKAFFEITIVLFVVNLFLFFLVKFEDTGKYKLGQISFQLNGLELLGPVPTPAPIFKIEMDKGTVELSPDTGELCAGLIQSSTLTLNSGSYCIKEVTYMLLYLLYFDFSKKIFPVKRCFFF